jgi:nucleoside-diphosphate-sugar epimerase
MMSALVGHTGFVGSNLLRQRRFDALYHSQNIEEIVGNEFDLLVVAGMPAAKWRANANPTADRATLDRLWTSLRQTQAKIVVIISTVDVYPVPIGVTEETSVLPETQHSYGRHRYLLEQFAREHFPRVLIVRLPGLFGPGLRKNAIYDLLHQHEIHNINGDGVFQFYNTCRLWTDIQLALDANLQLVNFATEPISIRDVARDVFGVELTASRGQQPPCYDVRTLYSGVFGGYGGYLDPREQILAELKSFVHAERLSARIAA